jgi:hypothetical protein
MFKFSRHHIHQLTTAALALPLMTNCVYREMLHQQLFLLNANLNGAILRSRHECVQVWELQLVGVKTGKIYSLQELQASYKAAAKVTLSLIPSKPAY